MNTFDPLYEGLLLQSVSVSKKATFQPRYIPLPPWLTPGKMPIRQYRIKLQLKH